MSRAEQLEKLRWRYEHRKAEGKSVIMDELCEEYHYHRKQKRKKEKGVKKGVNP